VPTEVPPTELSSVTSELARARSEKDWSIHWTINFQNCGCYWSKVVMSGNIILGLLRLCSSNISFQCTMHNRYELPYELLHRYGTAWPWMHAATVATVLVQHLTNSYTPQIPRSYLLWYYSIINIVLQFHYFYFFMCMVCIKTIQQRPPWPVQY